MRKPTEVLFVEDSPGDALLTGQILAEAMLPVRLRIARDGVQALTLLADRSFEPVLVILDLNLPNLSGFEVLQRNPRKEIPVVIFSASMNQADMDRALGLGAASYSHKPMDLEAYRDAVLAIIDLWADPRTEANGISTM
jgi:DNA-binding response OmpR family regulator